MEGNNYMDKLIMKKSTCIHSCFALSASMLDFALLSLSLYGQLKRVKEY